MSERERRLLEDGQRPLPFRGGIKPTLKRPAKTWAYGDGQRARLCPVCGCSEHQRCTVRLDDCVPAGVNGQRVCSACKQTRLFE